MLVAQVCPYSLSRAGGVQEQVIGLTRALRSSGHDTVVIAPCDGAPPLGGVRSVGRSSGVRANGSVSPVSLSPASARRTLRELDALARRGLDVVHIHEPLVPSVSLAALTWRGAPAVATFHRCGLGWPYRGAATIGRRAASSLGAGFAVSPEAARTARAAVGLDCPVLPNGVDLGTFAGARAAMGDRAPGGTDGVPSVLFVGRHERRKGLGVLLEAFQILARGGVVGAELRVAGDGPLTRELRSGFSHLRSVAWLGRIGPAQKVRELVSADVLCAPSLGGESFGIVLLEAMAAGTAIVASDIAGYRSVVRPGTDAVLVPPGRPGPLASVLRQVLDEPLLRRTLVDSALVRVQQFSMQALASRYVAAYESAVRTKPR